MFSLLRSANTIRCVRLNDMTLIPMSKTITTLQSPLFFQLSPFLLAEPLKKKKRLDPAIVKQREERRRKRLEKQIRKLAKSAKTLKPIDECEIPIEILSEKSTRARTNVTISEEECRQRETLLDQWAAHKCRQSLKDVKMIDRIVLSQQWALDNLKQESEELYQAAIQMDNQFIPIEVSGPVETPPIPNYDSPDGDYIDVSKKWDVNT